MLINVLSISVIAQSDLGFKYQAMIKDSYGLKVPNREVHIRLSLLFGDSDGNVKYVERHRAETNINSVIELNVGEGEVDFGDFTEIDWSKGKYFIQVELDIEGGSKFSIMGISQLMSVPYAMYAVKAGNANDADANPENELQDLILSGNKLRITNNPNASEIDLSSLSNDKIWDELAKKVDSDKVYTKEEVIEELTTRSESENSTLEKKINLKLELKADKDSVINIVKLNKLLKSKADLLYVESIKDISDNKLDKISVTDNLISYDSLSPLSAKQGRILNEKIIANTSTIASSQNLSSQNKAKIETLENNKISYTDISNELKPEVYNRPVSVDLGYRLSMRILENKSLSDQNKASINNIESSITNLDSDVVKKEDIIDGLSSNYSQKALSAKQGRVLKSDIDINSSEINNLKLNNSVLNDSITSLNSKTVKHGEVVNNLSSDSESNVLSAKQGKKLKELIDDKIDSSEVYKKEQVDLLLSGKENILGYIPENSSNRGVANGYAPLNSSGKISQSFLPNFQLSEIYTVLNETEQFALTPSKGDIAIRTDLNKSFIYNGGDVANISGWTELAFSTDVVTSMNGQKGDIILFKDDLGLANVENKSSSQIRSEITESDIPTAIVRSDELSDYYTKLYINDKILTPDKSKVDKSKLEALTVDDINNLRNLLNLKGDKSDYYTKSFFDSYIIDPVTKKVTKSSLEQLTVADIENLQEILSGKIDEANIYEKDFIDNTVLNANKTKVSKNKIEQLELEDINSLSQELDLLKSGKLNTEDVVDNLSSTDKNRVLSANQGRLLNETLTGKVDETEFSQVKSDVNANKQTIEHITINYLKTLDVKDNLISEDMDKPLSANQGKVLKGLIDELADQNSSYSKDELDNKLLQKQDAFSYEPENKTKKGVAGGYAPLDETGKVPQEYIPNIILSDVFVVESEINQLSLEVQKGDMAVRTDLGQTYVYNGGDTGTMEDWVKIESSFDGVTSVNGQTGTVLLDKFDLDLGNVENKSSAAIRSEITNADIPDEIARSRQLDDYYTKKDIQRMILAEGTEVISKSKIQQLEITDINRLNETLTSMDESKINRDDIVNNLFTEDNSKVLSSDMGVVLKDTLDMSRSAIENLKITKVNIDDIIDNLDSNDSYKPLSANQGSELNKKINTSNSEITAIKGDITAINGGISDLDRDKINKSDIVDALSSDDSGKILSAKQGKELKSITDNLNVQVNNLQSDKLNKSDIINSLSSNSTNKTLSALQGKELKTLVDKKLDAADKTVVSNVLTNTSTTEALSANMGHELKEDLDKKLYIKDKTIVVDDLITTNADYALSANQGNILYLLLKTKASDGALQHLLSKVELYKRITDDKIYADSVFSAISDYNLSERLKSDSLNYQNDKRSLYFKLSTDSLVNDISHKSLRSKMEFDSTYFSNSDINLSNRISADSLNYQNDKRELYSKLSADSLTNYNDHKFIRSKIKSDSTFFSNSDIYLSDRIIADSLNYQNDKRSLYSKLSADSLTNDNVHKAIYNKILSDSTVLSKFTSDEIKALSEALNVKIESDSLVLATSINQNRDKFGTSGFVVASKAMVVDVNRNINNVNELTATKVISTNVTLGGTNVTGISKSTTLLGNSDSIIPTEKAVKAYVDNEILSMATVDNVTSNNSLKPLSANQGYELKQLIIGNTTSITAINNSKGAVNGLAPLNSNQQINMNYIPSSSSTSLGNSNSLLPTQNAVKTYIKNKMLVSNESKVDGSKVYVGNGGTGAISSSNVTLNENSTLKALAQKVKYLESVINKVQIRLVSVNGALKYIDGTALSSASAYMNPPSGYESGMYSGAYWIKANDGVEYKVYCDMTTDGGGWMRLIRTTENNHDFGQATLSISYADVNSEVGVYETFDKVKSFSKVMLKSISYSTWASYNLVESSGGKSVMDIMKYVKNQPFKFKDDDYWDGARVIGLTSNYSGMKSAGNMSNVTYFFMAGVNEDGDNDQSYITFTRKIGQLGNGYGDYWRGVNQVETTWSFMNDDYHTVDEKHIGHGNFEAFAGYKSDGNGIYEVYIK